ncbi:TetR/AcrR family transcriptional regulator [Streptomyces sp. Je 1-79]|uniref:TetR/AcrR family transcriptional regulator n=1 Tax=Streptomyces sp. Je 1-79 TaxID=2943847 RepID=UPI0021A6235D|nr:TetR/AcrR family transcriptional regulator [Streptomyces sp. Je 1-79]MCT4356808.1 TetR/AcrR family transcriptional regulator [Streptomyces sp. Je 1-79]
MNVREHSGSPGPRRSTQAERRERTRAALLESAARGLSRHGYSNLVLEQVARDAGYTRGALYHQFKDKQDLALAVSEWVFEAWDREVGHHVEREPDPLAALLTLARAHTAFCRRDIARVAVALRLEFSGQDHPIGHQVEAGYRALVDLCTGRVEAGRAAGAIPAGPPAGDVALAYVGALEGTSIALAGRVPDDASLVVAAVSGALGLDPRTTHSSVRHEPRNEPQEARHGTSQVRAHVPPVADPRADA